MGKPTLQWLVKLAPLLCPMVDAASRGGHQYTALRPVAAHGSCVQSSTQHRGVCERENHFWHALRGCRGYASLAPGGVEAGKVAEEAEGLEGVTGDASRVERRREENGVADVDWIKATDRELQMQCRVETLRSSGPGGQHRNKTESAVRLLHLPTGLVAFAAEDRSQHKNRRKAFKRLREVIAMEVRRPVELEGYKAPPELMRILPSNSKASRKRVGGQKIGPNHDDFVQGVQPLLDLLGATKGSVSECAAILGLSTGALSRLLVSDRMLWKGVNNLRAAYNLKPLRGD